MEFQSSLITSRTMCEDYVPHALLGRMVRGNLCGILDIGDAQATIVDGTSVIHPSYYVPCSFRSYSSMSLHKDTTASSPMKHFPTLASTVRFTRLPGDSINVQDLDLSPSEDTRGPTPLSIDCTPQNLAFSKSRSKVS